ncbi:MAG: hypothetical protein V4556_11525 [Bacteroidota bacterium]
MAIPTKAKNPVKAGICVLPEEYKYSTALMYYTVSNEYDFITHLLA